MSSSIDKVLDVLARNEPAVAMFCVKWKCPPDTARYYLHKHGGNVSAAEEEYWRNHILPCDGSDDE